MMVLMADPAGEKNVGSLGWMPLPGWWMVDGGQGRKFLWKIF